MTYHFDEEVNVLNRKEKRELGKKIKEMPPDAIYAMEEDIYIRAANEMLERVFVALKQEKWGQKRLDRLVSRMNENLKREEKEI